MAAVSLSMGKSIAGIIIAILAASVISVGVSMVITGPRVQKDHKANKDHKASRAKQEQQDPQALRDQQDREDPQEQMEQMEQ